MTNCCIAHNLALLVQAVALNSLLVQHTASDRCNRDSCLGPAAAADEATTPRNHHKKEFFCMLLLQQFAALSNIAAAAVAAAIQVTCCCVKLPKLLGITHQTCRGVR
jgi:hypothetical protein